MPAAGGEDQEVEGSLGLDVWSDATELDEEAPSIKGVNGVDIPSDESTSTQLNEAAYAAEEDAVARRDDELWRIINEIAEIEDEVSLRIDYAGDDGDENEEDNFDDELDALLDLDGRNEQRFPAGNPSCTRGAVWYGATTWALARAMPRRVQPFVALIRIVRMRAALGAFALISALICDSAGSANYRRPRVGVSSS